MKIDMDRTRLIAQDWAQNAYYQDAEQASWMDVFWHANSPFLPLFQRLDLQGTVVELACGHGRHAAQIVDACTDLVLIDVNQTNIEACKARFADKPQVRCLHNNGVDIPLPDNSVRTIFCYDAMVHFEYDAIAAYLGETERVLAPGGRALYHHSNYDGSPGAHYMQSPHARNFMTTRLFQHMARRSELEVLDTVTFGWGGGEFRREDIDGLTLVQKPLPAPRVLPA